MVTTGRMRWWHIAPVLELERQLFGDEPWTAYHFWSELGQLETRWYRVALEGERVVGYAGLCDYPDEAFVQTLAVSPDVAGQGLGTALLNELLGEAERRGQRRVSLEVRADNAVAQRLYERHGFRRTAIRRGYYQPSGIDGWVLTRTA